MENNLCRFCGQILMDGSECNCSSAYAQRKIEVQKAAARKAVEDIFGEGSQDNGFDPIMEEDFHALILIADLAAEKEDKFRYSRLPSQRKSEDHKRLGR